MSDEEVSRPLSSAEWGLTGMWWSHGGLLLLAANAAHQAAKATRIGGLALPYDEDAPPESPQLPRAADVASDVALYLLPPEGSPC
jgi:hypothetical protein